MLKSLLKKKERIKFKFGVVRSQEFVLEEGSREIMGDESYMQERENGGRGSRTLQNKNGEIVKPGAGEKRIMPKKKVWITRAYHE